MKKSFVILLLLVGVVGCGGDSSPPTQTADADAVAALKNADAVAALKRLGGRIKQNEQGDVVHLNLAGLPLTDVGLEHLKGLTELQGLKLGHTC